MCCSMKTCEILNYVCLNESFMDWKYWKLSVGERHRIDIDY